MGRYVLKRCWTMLWTLLLVSILIFWIVNLPPGDVLTNQIQQLRASGEGAAVAKAEFLMREYALDRPMWEQYLIWMGFWPGPNGFAGLLQGNLGWSFELYIVALPLGAIAAVRANTWIDYAATFVGYIGLATPNFLLALILYHKGAQWFGIPVGGLMGKEYVDAPMSLAKLGDIMLHMIVPIIVIGTSGMAAMVRRLRANLLDELGKPYVTTARAKGVGKVATVTRYPLRMALNPFVADIGNLLPSLVSGSVLVSLVMGLQTIGPILLSALRSQDYFLSGFILLFVSVLTLLGMLVSDLLLAVLDPRIRFSGRRR